MPRSRSSAKVLFLETQLDEDIASTRSEIRFMREFLANFPWLELIAKEAHSTCRCYAISSS